uniref:Transmembrane protein 14C n=1 Tax=Takifugu rubripes TaxID=31033 RepID=A0A3B5KIB1_TAKRU
MAVDWVGFTYAVLVTSGGLLGYVKAGSVASLAAGLLFGLFAALGAYMMSQNPKNILGFSNNTWHLWNSDCGDGTKISQLWQIHASRIHDDCQKSWPYKSPLFSDTLRQQWYF